MVIKHSYAEVWGWGHALYKTFSCRIALVWLLLALSQYKNGIDPISLKKSEGKRK